MFIKSHHVLFLTLLIVGTLVAVSSNSWFTAWLGLEINLMSMIPLILVKLTPQKTEASIKYFIAQALASIILILSVAVNLLPAEGMTPEINELLISASLIMKAGLSPFHFWFPQVAQLLNWTQCLIIFTWQKIAPLLLLVSLNSSAIFCSSILSALTGALGGFNQSFLKLLLTYSSISHSGWMLMGCLMSTKTWLMYFLIYSFLSLAVVYFFSSNKTFKTSHIFLSSDSNFSKIILTMNMLSLGGLPPLLGFAAKLSILLVAFKNSIIILLTFMIFGSLLSLFFYARLIYTNLMNKNNQMKIVLPASNKTLSFLHTFSMAANLTFPLFFIFN